MNFQCRNCSANMIFDPERQKMYCPFCDGVDCAEQKGDESITTCPSCGGALEVEQFTSATKCPSCGNYIILDPRVSGKYKPSRLIPFKLTKKAAVEAMEREFEDRLFTPASFLSEKTLVDMQGYYVPFFMYDYHVDGVYDGEGTKTRSWRSGNYDYTEVSYYRLLRKMTADYDNVPADASVAMPDKTMDLLEPYNYGLLTDFKPEFMSGFFGEVYNMEFDELRPRATEKASKSAGNIMKASMSEYSLRKPEVDTLNMSFGETEYALLPVWKYQYRYGGLIYDFYVNGESGKVIGKTPISKWKVFIYGLTTAAIWTLALDLILGFVGSLIF